MLWVRDVADIDFDFRRETEGVCIMRGCKPRSSEVLVEN